MPDNLLTFVSSPLLGDVTPGVAPTVEVNESGRGHRSFSLLRPGVQARPEPQAVAETGEGRGQGKSMRGVRAQRSEPRPCRFPLRGERGSAPWPPLARPTGRQRENQGGRLARIAAISAASVMGLKPKAGTRPVGQGGPVHESPAPQGGAKTPDRHTVLQTGSRGSPIGVPFSLKLFH